MEIITRTVTIRHIEYDGIKFYPDRKGYWMGQRKDEKKLVRLHVYVWERHNGPVPKGHQIHHIDHNPDNNEIENLQLMSKADHLKYHAALVDPQKAKANFLKHVQPAAIEWHKSEEGMEWHKAHYEQNLAKYWERTITRTCDCCGKEFETPFLMRHKSRFCSNACKTRNRDKIGIDNVEKTCDMCRGSMWTNKYTPNRFCSPECKQDYLDSPKEVICKKCGETFTTPRRRFAAQYCSDECRGRTLKPRPQP